jgi:spore germination protein GerM
VAAPRKRKTNPPPEKPTSFVFWTLFFIVIISLFFLNLQLIRSNVKQTGLLDRIFNRQAAQPPQSEPVPELPQELPPQAFPTTDMGERAPEPNLEEPLPDEEPLELDPSAAGPVAPPVTAERDRALYFIEVDGDGAILRTRVVRSMPATDSPLTDTLRLLLQGPTVDEQNRGLITLIPPGTGLRNAQVRGSTAYLSFSEEFQFNTYGVEGYIGQLRQIIWTVTEFPNVSDVQILIEGRRIDYLGERIAIGSPLGRNSF